MGSVGSFTNKDGNTDTTHKGYIKSSDYDPANAGWQISSDGNAEFNKLFARKSGQIANWEISS